MEYSEYWSQIEAIATEVTREARESGEDINDRLHEAIDGHEYVIYTSKALDVLQHSTNDDAIFDEMGDDALSGCSSMTEVYTRACYYAMCADVRDHDAFDADFNDDDDESEG